VASARRAARRAFSFIGLRPIVGRWSRSVAGVAQAADQRGMDAFFLVDFRRFA
jgi:hypothetical protein